MRHLWLHLWYLQGEYSILGDYLFVFTFDLGIKGAGQATAIGAVITALIMYFHFFRKENTLKSFLPERIPTKIKEIVEMGFSTFITDVAMGVLTIFFNRQIMRYLNSDALSVYGVIVNISTIVQCCGYSVGQA